MVPPLVLILSTVALLLVVPPQQVLALRKFQCNSTSFGMSFFLLGLGALFILGHRLGSKLIGAFPCSAVPG